MTHFKLPDLGEGLEDARIVEWHINVGDRVVKDQPLVSVETAKAIVEVPSPISGVVTALGAAVDSKLDVGAMLADIVTDEEAPSNTSGSPGIVGDIPEDVGRKDATLDSTRRVDAREASPRAVPPPVMPPSTTQAPATPLPVAPPPATPPATVPRPDSGKRIQATPLVRAYAAQHDVDLANVPGSGPAGSVTQVDVDRYIAAAGSIDTTSLKAGSAIAGSARKRMTELMQQSGRCVVPATVTDYADVSEWPTNTDPTVRCIVAITAACNEEPMLNAFFDEQSQQLQGNAAINVGLAADLPQGLFVPVLHDVAAKDSAQIRSRIDELLGAINEGTISAQAMTGATISYSNFGMLGGIHAQLVVVPPQVSILGTGSMREMPVVIDGVVQIRKLLPISLTFDHRGITGGEAMRFLNAFIRSVEDVNAANV